MKIELKHGDKVRVTDGFYKGKEGILDSVLYSDRKGFELYSVGPLEDLEFIKNEGESDMTFGTRLTMEILNKQHPFYVKGEDLELI